MVIGVLLAVWAFALIGSRAKVVATDDMTARVVEVIEVNKSKYSSAFLARVVATDGREIRLFLPLAGPRPSVGDEVPLVAEHYDDGDTLYQFDAGRWRGHAGAAE